MTKLPSNNLNLLMEMKISLKMEMRTSVFKIIIYLIKILVNKIRTISNL